MKISNIDELLREVEQDKNVGVKLVLLTGDNETSVFAIELMQGQLIPAHYHTKGIETYFLLSGEGMVSTGRMQGSRCVWEREKQVRSGDCFSIHPNEVHWFKNLSDQTLKIIATAPLSHSGNDRFFVGEKQHEPSARQIANGAGKVVNSELLGQ